MLRQEELAFLKAISTLRLSPAILRELKTALSRKKRPAVPAGIRGTTPGCGARAPQRPQTQLAGKRKANELASSGESSEPAIRRPAPDDGSASLPASPAAACGRQLGPIEGGATYAAALAGPAAPSLPSGPLKPTAMGSDSSEPAVSPESASRRMSNDMSGPLSGKPDGTTSYAQVSNTCVRAGERPNKTPIFITGVSDTRSFLAWLRASCPDGLTAQLKGEKLMVVPSTADGFRAVVSTLRSIDGREGVSFHTFTLPEDRCVRLLVKNLGRGMPESVVREELESLNIRVQGVIQLRSGRRDQDPTKDRLPTPTPLFRWREGSRCQKYDYSQNSADCECRWRRTWPPKAHCNANAASALDTRSVSADTRPCASRVAAPHIRWVPYHARKPQCCSCRGNHTANYRGCIK